MNSSFPNRWSFSYLKFTKYVTNIIAEPKYKYGQQEQATVRNHNRSTAFKLFGCGIGGKTLKWIDSFLCYRQQRVVVNRAKSDWAPVLSGIPKGTVLGPLLFSLYINDISTDIDSEIRLFADEP